MSSRRLLLLEACADLFTRYGFRKTSVEDITRAASVSKGSFYLEFRSKDDLFEALVRHEFRTYLADASQRIAIDPEGGRLSRIYHHCIEALLCRDFLRALYTQNEQILPTIVRRRGPHQYRPRVLLGAEFIDRMQKAGLIRTDSTPEALSHTLSVLMVGPLLAEPILHDEYSPTLSETLAAISSMIVTTFEAVGGDIEEGKRAFAGLEREVGRALSHPDTQR